LITVASEIYESCKLIFETHGDRERMLEFGKEEKKTGGRGSGRIDLVACGSLHII
jgi:hypothetical protein